MKSEIVKLFDSLVGKRNRYILWNDMIYMFAASIAVPLSGDWAQERERQYGELARHYSREELLKLSEIFGMIINDMETASESGEYSDMLGDLFMKMELGNDAGGQFFTPYHIALMMARIAAHDGADRIKKGEPFITVNEPSCGAGATLIAHAQAMREAGINYQERCFYVAQDLDFRTALMCYIQLSLLGCAGYVHIGDTLKAPPEYPLLFGDMGPDTWYTPMFFDSRWTTRRNIEMICGGGERCG